MFEREIWKDIEGYEGLYEISSFGRVKSYNGYGHAKKILLKPGKCRYYNVILSKNGEKKSFLIHRLVAQAFIPNPNNCAYINHKDENKLNNNVDNLEWCTQKYNCNYGTRTERGHLKQRKKINQYDLNGVFIKTWNSRQDINKKLGIPITTISGCCLGYLKSAHNYIWKYANDKKMTKT